MPLYEITLTASLVVQMHGATEAEAAQRAVAANPTLSEVEATDGNEIDDDPIHYEELPSFIQRIVDGVETDEITEVLGKGQFGNRMFDDGEWRVWKERVGPEDGYDGPAVTVEYYDGNRWSYFDPERHGYNDD